MDDDWGYPYILGHLHGGIYPENQVDLQRHSPNGVFSGFDFLGQPNLLMGLEISRMFICDSEKWPIFWRTLTHHMEISYKNCVTTCMVSLINQRLETPLRPIVDAEIPRFFFMA